MGAAVELVSQANPFCDRGDGDAHWSAAVEQDLAGENRA
jgi:hypothetical protein